MADKIKIYGELESATAEGILAEASAIRSSKDKSKTLADEIQELTEKVEEGVGGGVSELQAGENIKIQDNVISVMTTNNAEEDNTRPITSAGVNTIVGNINVLLELI